LYLTISASPFAAHLPPPPYLVIGILTRAYFFKTLIGQRNWLAFLGRYAGCSCP